MLANPCGKLERLVAELYPDNLYLAALEEGLKKYRIKCFNIASMRPNAVLQTYYQISERFYGMDSGNYFQYWHQNQLKIYIWLLVGYAFVKKRCLSQMTEEDWDYFSQIFKHRNPIHLEYQALLLLKSTTRNQRWDEDQVGLLKNLMNKNDRKNMWNDVARNLYVLSERKYFRTSKQCREYWINHLAPSLSKQPWKYREDYNLIEWAYKNNKKWSRVSKLFNGERTQHMVKNRFNSLYHFQLKKYPANGEKLQEEEIMVKLKGKLKLLMLEEEQNEKFAKTITDFEPYDEIMKHSQQKQLSYMDLFPQPQPSPPKNESSSFFNDDPPSTPTESRPSKHTLNLIQTPIQTQPQLYSPIQQDDSYMDICKEVFNCQQGMLEKNQGYYL